MKSESFRGRRQFAFFSAQLGRKLHAKHPIAKNWQTQKCIHQILYATIHIYVYKYNNIWH